MSAVRVIKKYPNRRLYDTQASRYITLEEVRQLVVAVEPFKVVAKATQEDITDEILLQVVVELERKRPTLGRLYLSGLIRTHHASGASG